MPLKVNMPIYLGALDGVESPTHRLRPYFRGVSSYAIFK
jgi:hypothetical protein